MRNFYVKFTHGPDREEIGKVMSGASGRDVAWKIRKKYHNVRIEAIRAVGDGAAVWRKA